MHRHLTTWDRSSHIFQHRQQSEECRRMCLDKCYSILNHITTKYQVKIEEALHIHWEQPTLNTQQPHYRKTVTSLWLICN